MQNDDFEWDDLKAEANLKKHKITFDDASKVFNDPFAYLEQDVSEDYGEDRFVAVGLVNGVLIAVIYTERVQRIRIISARKASTYEQQSYDRS